MDDDVDGDVVEVIVVAFVFVAASASRSFEVVFPVVVLVEVMKAPDCSVCGEMGGVSAKLCIGGCRVDVVSVDDEGGTDVCCGDRLTELTEDVVVAVGAVVVVTGACCI